MTAARMGQIEVDEAAARSRRQRERTRKKFGQTALMWAAGHPAVVRMLVDRGADIRLTTPPGT